MTTEKQKSPFETLYEVNVNGHTEKKGAFTYLSWPFAVAEISKADPNVFFEYPEPATYKDGSVMVFANVTAFGKTMKAFLPVMDNKNKAIPNPNAFDVNKAMQRCLVKAIALHGLGLYIYAGEDLPETDLVSEIESAKSISALGKLWNSLNGTQQSELQEKFTARKLKLTPKEAA
jgi:hypothetical protein